MSTNPDACPNCGHNVPSSGMSHGIGSGHPSETGRPMESNEQSAVCPECDARLHRRVGDAWHIDSRPG